MAGLCEGGFLKSRKENTGILLEPSKEIDLEVNSEKTKYMIISRDQNIVRNGSIEIGNLFFEEEEKFKYIGATGSGPLVRGWDVTLSRLRIHECHSGHLLNLDNHSIWVKANLSAKTRSWSSPRKAKPSQAKASQELPTRCYNMKEF
ncbi:hypothetical protein ANN_18407 [Periplaneta americana]|uniref:Uncharacterized protein n=1 Tax=Periplaneta americana TaxID=6978 RepID=A0ABQ8SP54_PERAM|nr:hypothetical protein ANN_18407 [Periplaneta americana]